MYIGTKICLDNSRCMDDVEGMQLQAYPIYYLFQIDHAVYSSCKLYTDQLLVVNKTLDSCLHCYILL